MWLTRSTKPFLFQNEYDRELPYGDCDSLGLYIHIPFCNSICSYCDFCKIFYNKKYIKDAKLRALWTKFAGILDGNIRLLKENKSAVKIQGFMLQGKELNAVSMEERRAAAKLARSLNKIKKLKAQQGYDEVKELLKKDFVDLFPYDEHSVEFGRMISWYPALLAKELGINNVPDFEDMTAISADHFDKVKIRFADYYPKSQIVEWLKENYDYERERNLLKIFREQYDIEDEVREMERQFSNPLPEQ